MALWPSAPPGPRSTRCSPPPCSSAFAQDAGAVAQNFAWLGDNMRSLSHTLMTIGGVGLAIGLAAQAFGRRQVNVANVPTFPRYMTSPQQCRFGSIVFIIFASGFFLLLVYEHKEVARVADLFGEGLAKNVIDAIKDDAAPYLLVVAAMCAVYLYCLKTEASWNPPADDAGRDPHLDQHSAARRGHRRKDPVFIGGPASGDRRGGPQLHRGGRSGF